MKKRIGMTVIQLFVLCLLSLLGVSTAKAAEKGQKTMDGTTFIYEIRDAKKKTINITKIENTKEKLVIPSKINGYSVYRIGKQMGNLDEISLEIDYKESDEIKILVIKNGIKEIGQSAFYYMKNLSKISIPKSVKLIGNSAFYKNLKLKEIKLTNPKVELKEDAFSRCSKLCKVTFPKGEFKGKIGENAFAWCGIKELKLPYMKNLNEKQVGRYAFTVNKKLKKVTFSNQYKKIALGRDWFTDCPKVQITIGKQVKTFSSKVNAHAGTVRLLGKQTKLTGFKKPKNRSYYYIQFKKFIVPKNSKALPILRNACWGTVNDRYHERHAGRKNYYFSQSEADMNEVKVVIK